MRRNEPISSIMTTDVQSVHTAQKPSEVRQLLASASFHHVPVLDGTKVIGIISATDMARLSLGAFTEDVRSVDMYLDAQFSVADMMTPEPTVLNDHATVRKAAEVLAEGNFHALPVVTKGGALAGMVTSTDVIRYLLTQY